MHSAHTLNTYKSYLAGYDVCMKDQYSIVVASIAILFLVLTLVLMDQIQTKKKFN